MDIRGKVAIVTGGARRIGRALAIGLARNGCDVLVHYHTSRESAHSVKTEIESCGVRCSILRADLANPDEVAGVVAGTVTALGAPDILVNNAAVFRADDTFGNTDTNIWQAIMDINLRAPYFLSQAFATLDVTPHRRHIVSITDARTNRPATDHPVYRLSKSSLSLLTRILALELAPAIAVNDISIGAVLPPEGEDDVYLEHRARTQVPLRRTGETPMVVDTLLHLLKQDYVTGTSSTLDGGEYV